MNFIVENWLLISIALASGALLLLPVMQGAASTGLGPNDVVQLINREKAVVIDVCEPNEFAAGHVVGARNIPLGQLEEKLPQAVKNKALPVVLVCQSGMRSGRALSTAKKLGFEKAYSLAGGLGAWKTLNLPVEKA
ncbi:MAG: hypothetical protein RLZZ591_2441 [Pseudomonadota bacterium]